MAFLIVHYPRLEHSSHFDPTNYVCDFFGE